MKITFMIFIIAVIVIIVIAIDDIIINCWK